MSVGAKHTAVILSGGGAYGAFSVGVMKVLFAGRCSATQYQPLEAGIFTGTSIGAFNAALMVSFPDEDCLETALRLESIWLDRVAERPGHCGNGIFRLRGDPLEYLDADCLGSSPLKITNDVFRDVLSISGYLASRAANFLSSSLPLRNRLINSVNLGSFVDSSPTRDLLHQVIRGESIVRSPLKVGIVATNWVTGKAVYFNNADFTDDREVPIIMASSALPGIFPPVLVGADLFVDGGVVENTPLATAINSGATNLHVIYLDPSPKFIPFKGEPNTIDTLLRVYSLMLARKIEADIETARWINAGIRAGKDNTQTDSLPASEVEEYLKAGGRSERPGSSYKIVTIHRYFPTSSLGGDLGMLDFNIERIAEVIAVGERVALTHNCEENGCILR